MSLSSSKVPGQGARFTPRYEGHYLTPEQLDVLRSNLLNWRDDVLNDAQHTIDQMRDDSHFEVGDEGDRAQRETSQTLELRTRDRQRKLLRKIEQALLRIETGDYGYCEETGEPIGYERLRIRPMATMCVAAQEAHEKRERNYRG
ncbi:RNA polymerase-binding protein DksA [Oceanococcus atlanticus]|uniref:RNA polymerase-binding protein DksA n=1 Tax=Oceanococcus atlanticus TaxID=1317117 RepID=A0A1Y1SDI5_9GAMM|nr:RNA polymerase-binding protein DksA [Oceanococcus atlanticus]ORE87058.1 RNA polymerase-binding protein DksA [Oceanococcus atlanticus]